MMEYKGYQASVEFDVSADVLHGRVTNAGPYPIATFEATETRALRRAFEWSVDEYLRSCEEDGVEPRRPFAGRRTSCSIPAGTRWSRGQDRRRSLPHGPSLDPDRE